MTNTIYKSQKGRLRGIEKFLNIRSRSKTHFFNRYPISDLQQVFYLYQCEFGRKRNKIYIGKRTTKSSCKSALDDFYTGSGRHPVMLRFIRMFGEEAVQVRILETFFYHEDVRKREAQIVTKEFCDREDTFNQIPGGYSSFKKDTEREEKIKMCEEYGIPYVAMSDNLKANKAWQDFVNVGIYSQFAPFTWLERNGLGFSILIHELGFPPDDDKRYRIAITSKGEFVWKAGLSREGELITNPFGKKDNKQFTDKIVSCIHCQEPMTIRVLSQWHGDRCKENPNRELVKHKKYKIKVNDIEVCCIHCRCKDSLGNFTLYHGDNCIDKKTPMTDVFQDLFN